MGYAARILASLGITGVLSVGAFSLLPGQPPYRIKILAVGERYENQKSIIAHSSRCNGLYDTFELRINGEGSMHPLGMELYEEDVRYIARFFGFDENYLEFENCDRPSRIRPLPNTRAA